MVLDDLLSLVFISGFILFLILDSILVVLGDISYFFLLLFDITCGFTLLPRVNTGCVVVVIAAGHLSVCGISPNLALIARRRHAGIFTFTPRGGLRCRHHGKTLIHHQLIPLLPSPSNISWVVFIIFMVKALKYLEFYNNKNSAISETDLSVRNEGWRERERRGRDARKGLLRVNAFS